MHQELKIIGPIVPVPSEEPALLPVVQTPGPTTTASGLLDVRALARLQDPGITDEGPHAGPAAPDTVQLPRFASASLTGLRTGSPDVEPPPEPIVEPEAPPRSRRRAPLFVLAAVASALVVVGLVAI